jgi:hypothetical protein
MTQKDQYDPAVYKRLDLVRKQFEAHQAEQRKQQAAERRRERFALLGQNKVKIGRIVVYALLGIMLLAVIFVVIRGV